MNPGDVQPKAKARIAKIRLLIIFMAISLLIGSVTSIQGGDIYDYLEEGMADNTHDSEAEKQPPDMSPLCGLVGTVVAGGYRADSTPFEWEWRSYYEEAYLE